MDNSEACRSYSKIHRLYIHFSGEKDGSIPRTVSLSQVRSIVMFGSSAYRPPFLKFKYVKVLALKFSNASGDIFKDLAGICWLLQLRYLRITILSSNYGRKLIEQPSEIGMLQHLETLEILCSKPISILPDIVDLPSLLHLILPGSDVCLPEGIGKMKSLRTLGVPRSSLDNIKALGELTNLRVLHLFGGLGGSKWVAEKARYRDALSSLSPAFHQLESLVMYGWLFSKVPKWIAKLHNLSFLFLEVRGVLMNDDVHIFAELPALISLFLRIEQVPINEILVVYSMAFLVLKYFSFACPMMLCMIFEAGAMPNLQNLELNFDAHGWNKHGTTLVGIEHLSRLKDIFVGIGAWGVMESDRTTAESALRNAIDGDHHPNHPRVKITYMSGRQLSYDNEKDMESINNSK